MIDELFAALLKKHTITEIYKMDVLELLRLTNLDHAPQAKVEKSSSFFDLMK